MYSFALLDFAEQFPMQLEHTIVMETGGMKGRRKELVREDLHACLQKGFWGKNNSQRVWHDRITLPSLFKGEWGF